MDFEYIVNYWNEYGESGNEKFLLYREAKENAEHQLSLGNSVNIKRPFGTTLAYGVTEKEGLIEY